MPSQPSPSAISADPTWLLNQRWFAVQINAFGSDRLRTLDGDAFNTARAETLKSIADFTTVPLSPDAAEAAAASDVFTTHSKRGTGFAAQEAEDAQRANSPVIEDEIAKVEEWIGLIAQQMGLQMPVNQPL